MEISRLVQRENISSGGQTRMKYFNFYLEFHQHYSRQLLRNICFSRENNGYKIREVGIIALYSELKAEVQLQLDTVHKGFIILSISSRSPALRKR